VAVDILFGLAWVVCGVGGIIFRKPLLRLTKQANSKINPRVRPTERFIEIQQVVVSVCFIGTGGLVIVAAIA